MNLLEDLQREIQGTSAAVARAERLSVQFPDDLSVLATLTTVRKRQEILEEEFFSAARELGLETCRYSIEYENRRRATITRVASALNNFQRLFTIMYDAVVNGPKKRYRVSDEIIDLTSFGFGYAYSGSIGVVMTLPNDSLIHAPEFHKAMQQTYVLLQARNTEVIQSLIETVGLAAVRQAHDWASENAKAGFGANIIWQGHGADEEIVLRVQPGEFGEIAQVIESANAEEEETLVAELTDVLMGDRIFKMTARGVIIEGTFENAISQSRPARIPGIYTAVLKVRTKVISPEGSEERTYFLERLSPASPEDFALSLS